MRIRQIAGGLHAVVKRQQAEVGRITSSRTGDTVAISSLMGLLFVLLGVLLIGSMPWVFVSDENGGRAAGVYFAIAGVWLAIVGVLAWALVVLGSLAWRLALRSPTSPKVSLARVCERSVRRVTEGTGIAVLLSVVSTLFWLVMNPPVGISTPQSRINDLGLVQISVLVVSLGVLLLLELPRVSVEALEHFPPLVSWSHGLLAPLVAIGLLTFYAPLSLRFIGHALLDQFIPLTISGIPHAQAIEIMTSNLWDWVPGDFWVLVIFAWVVQLVRLRQIRRLISAVKREAAAASFFD